MSSEHPTCTALDPTAPARQAADRALFEHGLDEDLLEALRDATNRGSVPGRDRFRHAIAETLGRRVAPPRRGRPPKDRPVAPAQDVAKLL